MKFTIYQESRIGKRANNEDRLAYSYSRESLLMVVADGMGGHHYGEVAAQMAVQTLIEAFQRQALPKIDDPFIFLHRAMINAHHAIQDFSELHDLDDAPRTTCVACLIQDNIAHWAHAGDSRLYLFRNGRVQARTRDHSQVQYLLDQGMINAVQAKTHPDRNKVYSCLGGYGEPEVELSRKMPLSNGDMIVLCTDGLWSVLPDEQLLRLLKGDALISAVPAVLDLCDAQGRPNADNFSILVVHWEDRYVEAGSGISGFVSTRGMSRETVTTKLDEFGRNPSYKTELTEEEIEHAIEEIRSAIQKYSK